MSRHMKRDGTVFRAVITIVHPPRPADRWYPARESWTDTYCVGPYTTRAPATHAITKAKSDRRSATVTGYVEQGAMKWTPV